MAASLALVLGAAAGVAMNRFTRFRGRALFAFMLTAPLVVPEVILGLSLLLLFVAGQSWVGWPAERGVPTVTIAHATFAACFVAVLVRAQLAGFDRGLEEAALDLGANHTTVMRRILLPHLYPAIGAGAAIAFFQSIENFNTTLFTRGTYDTLTVYVFSKVRSGITPTINALALILISVTVVCAIWYEISRRRSERKVAQASL